MIEFHQALTDIAQERARQRESWSEVHDDGHVRGELSDAAACYALFDGNVDAERVSAHSFLWPWSEGFWKPKNKRRDLVRAGALIIAEIERLDRAAKKGGAS